jgi:uncharacterized membrane protein YccC
MLNLALTNDPGLVNFKNALRGTLAVVISFFAASFLARSFHQPPSIAFIAVIVAMIGSLAVSDATRREKMRTLFLIPFLALATLSFSILTGPFPALRIAGFLLIAFLAVYLRRFGPRGIAIGMVGFMTYFCPLFFPLPISALPCAGIAVVVGVLIIFLFKFVLIPDYPEKDLNLYLRSFTLLGTDVLIEVERQLKKAANLTKVNTPALSEREVQKGRAKIQAHLLRLNELGLTLEGLLNSSDSLAVKSKSETLQMHLFERELAIRQFLDFVSEWVLTNPSDLLAAAQLVHDSVNRNLNKSVSMTFEKESLQQFAGALLRLKESEVTPLQKAEIVSNIIEEKAESPLPPLIPKLNLTSKENTRQAIQATLATGLASILGASISQNRWYWASITAFVVFAGATRGENLQRAFLRIVGTIAGLVLGFLAAYALSGHHALEWSVVIACVFIGIFGARAHFGFWTGASFTSMLALLYDILGQLTSQLLILRLEETAVGALIGAAVAAWVLPASTSATIKSAMQRFLVSMSEALQELSKQTTSPFERRDLVRTLRQVDRELMALRTAASPIVGPMSILKKGDLPTTVYESSVLAHFLRHLAFYTGPFVALSREQTAVHCLQMSKNLEVLASGLDLKASADPQLQRPPVPAAISIGDPGQVPDRWVGRMDQIIRGLFKVSLFN